MLVKALGSIIDYFQVARTIVLKVIFTIFIMFPSGSLLKVLLNESLLLPRSSISWFLLLHSLHLLSPLVDTTAATLCVQFVGSVVLVYCAAPVQVVFKNVFVFLD